MKFTRSFAGVITIDHLKMNIDLIISILLFTITISTLWWIPICIPTINMNLLVASISPISTAVGVLIAHRTNEKLKSPKLKIVDCNFFKLSISTRVYVEVENSRGREIANDAKPQITIKKIKNGEELDLEIDDLPSPDELIRLHLLLSSLQFWSVKWDFALLVPPKNPKVEGEYIPWMVPEMSYRAKGLHGIEFKHITNIAPGQRVRAAIFDVVKDGMGQLWLLIFSEYGTELEMSGNKPVGFVRPAGFVRVLRCILRPGKYSFYLSISADKAYPAKAVLDVETKGEQQIIFSSSTTDKSYYLRELLP